MILNGTQGEQQAIFKRIYLAKSNGGQSFNIVIALNLLTVSYLLSRVLTGWHISEPGIINII